MCEQEDETLNHFTVCRSSQQAWSDCEDATIKRVFQYLQQLLIHEDGKIQKRVSKVTFAQLKKILFAYIDPAYERMKDHLREELMKGLIANTQVKLLAKLTTNKLGNKLMLIFLKVFYEEFNTALWIPRCAQMIIYERQNGIMPQHKHGTRNQ